MQNFALTRTDQMQYIHSLLFGSLVFLNQVCQLFVLDGNQWTF